MSAKVSKGMYGNLCSMQYSSRRRPQRVKSTSASRAAGRSDAVTDEDDYRDDPIIAFEFSMFSVTIDRFSLIVAELSIVEPDRLPLRTI